MVEEVQGQNNSHPPMPSDTPALSVVFTLASLGQTKPKSKPVNFKSKQLPKKVLVAVTFLKWKEQVIDMWDYDGCKKED